MPIKIQPNNATILRKARECDEFRERVVQLGRAADSIAHMFRPAWEIAAAEMASVDFQHSESDKKKFLTFIEGAFDLAEEVGFFAYPLSAEDTETIQNWFLDRACELRFALEKIEDLKPGKPHLEQVGKVFLSWSVKSVRDRASINGIKQALNWLNVTRFDYTENQLDDSFDRQGDIRDHIKREVENSKFSIESVSTDMQARPWIDFERALIRDNESIHRIRMYLESDKFRNGEYWAGERETGIDISNGHRSQWSSSPASGSPDYDTWRRRSSDIGYFKSVEYYGLCYDLVLEVRGRLRGNERPFGRIPILSSSRKAADREKFLSAAIEIE